MKKKILISLLVAQPAAFSAMADINTDLGPVATGTDGWNTQGNQNKEDNGVVTAMPGSTFTKTLTLQPGKYIIEISDQKNVSYTVSVDGGKTYTNPTEEAIEIRKESKVTITVTAKDSNLEGFSLSGIKVTIDFDDAADVYVNFANKLENAKNTILSVTSETSSLLAEDKQALTEKYNNIKKVLDENILNGISENTYDTYGLAKYPGYLEENPDPADNITEDIKAFEALVEAYNQKVPVENARQEAHTANANSYGSLSAIIGTAESPNEGTLWAAYNALANDYNASTSDYAKGKVNLEGVKKQLTDYIAAVDEIFALHKTTDSKETLIDQETVQGLIDEANTVLDAIETAQTTFDNAEADDAAYQKIIEASNDLEDAYNKGVSVITTAKATAQPAEKYGEYFIDKQADRKKTITTIYEEAKAKITVVEGAIEGCRLLTGESPKDGYDQVVETQKAIDDITAQSEGFKLEVDANNEAMATAQEKIKTVEDTYTEAVKWLGGTEAEHSKFPAEVEAARSGYIQQIDEKLAAVKGNVDAEYKNLSLDAVDYTAALSEISDLINKLEALQNNPLLKLQSSLDTAKETIKTNDAQLTDFNLYAKFEDVIDEIQNKLDGTDPDDIHGTTDLTEIEQSITNLTTNASTLFDGVKSAQTSLTTIASAVDDLTKAIDEKYCPDGREPNNTYFHNTYKATTAGQNKTVKEWEDLLTELNTAYTALNGLNGTELLTAVDEFNNQEGLSDFPNQINADKGILLTEMTKQNLAVAETKIGDIKTDLDNYKNANSLTDLPGYTDDFFDAVNTTASNIESAITSASGDQEKLATEDENIKTLLDTITELEKTASAIKANHQAYTDLTTALTNAKANVDKVIEYNNKTSTLGAADFYDKQLQALTAELAAIETALGEAYAKGTGAENANAKKKELTDQINGVNTAADNIMAAIDANEAAHQKQFDEGVDVLKLLNTVYTSVENKDSELVAEWKEGLDAIKTALNGIDTKVLNTYEKGQSAEKDAELMQKYADQKALIEGIQTEITDGYGQKVLKENKNLLDEWGWNAELADLWKAYDAAVAAYVYYRDDLKNDGYKDALAGVIKTSKDIYDFYTPIRTLESDVKYYMGKCNSPETGDPVLMDKDEINKFIAEGDQILADMKAKVSEMEANVEAAAIAYYETQLAAAKQLVTDATDAMTAAGIEDEIQAETVKAVNELIAAAEKAYNNPDTTVSETLLSHRMDDIANILDQANAAAIDTQAAAEQQWDKTYGEQEQVLVGLKTDLDTYTFDTQLSEVTTQFDDLKSQAAELNKKAEAADDLLAELKDDTDDLAQIVSEATQLVNDSKARHDANKANQDLYDAYTGMNTDLEARYDKLVAYVNTLAANIDYDNVRAAIDAFWKAVNDNKADLLGNKTDIDAKHNTASDAIDAAIENEAKAEIQWLNDEADVVKAAFNDAKSKITDVDKLNGYNDQINTLIKSIAELEDKLKPSAGLTHDKILALANEMTGLEKQLCDLEVELKAIGEQPNPVDNIQEALQKQYEEVATAISEGKAFLESEDTHADVQEQYAPEYETLQAELDAVKAAWEADGNNVIAQQDNHKAAMEDILEKVNNLNEEVQATEAEKDALDAKQQANEDAYAVLNKAYEQALAYYTQVKETLEGYTYGTYSNYEASLLYVQTLLETAKTDIDNKYNAGELTADDNTLPDQETIYSTLDATLANATTAELDGWIKAAKYAVSTAQATLPAKIVSDVRAEIEATLADLATQAAALSNVWIDEEGKMQLEVANNTISEAQRIIEEAATQTTLATENAFVLGDVNVDNIVDAADVQALINLIGNDFDNSAYETTDPMVREAADINGNKRFDAGDIAAVVNLYLNDTPWNVRTAMFAPAVQGDNHLSLQLVSEENGVSRYAVEITNAAAFVAGQMDIIVPDNMEIVEVSTAGRASEQDLYRFDNQRGMRLILASMTNAAIEGNQGAVVYIDVTGRGHLDVENVTFADRRGVCYDLTNDLSGINSPLRDTLNNVKEAIYNVAGQAMNGIRRGINIIRKSDGTTTKEYRK